MQDLNRDDTRPHDPKKDDGSGPEVASTVRSCFMKVVNRTGKVIENVVLTHTSGSKNTPLSTPKILNNDESFPLAISYETGGFLPDFDYWQVSFKIGHSVYATPYNDRCNIEASDAGKVIGCELKPSGQNYSLFVNLPSGDGCPFIIKKSS